MENILFIQIHCAPRAGKPKMYLAIIDYIADTFDGILLKEDDIDALKSTIERKQQDLAAANKRWNIVNVSTSKYSEKGDTSFYNLYVEGELVGTLRPVRGKFLNGAVGSVLFPSASAPEPITVPYGPMNLAKLIDCLKDQLNYLDADTPAYVRVNDIQKCHYVDDVEVLGNAVVLLIDDDISPCNTTYKMLYDAQ